MSAAPGPSGGPAEARPARAQVRQHLLANRIVSDLTGRYHTKFLAQQYFNVMGNDVQLTVIYPRQNAGGPAFLAAQSLVAFQLHKNPAAHPTGSDHGLVAIL